MNKAFLTAKTRKFFFINFPCHQILSFFNTSMTAPRNNELQTIHLEDIPRNDVCYFLYLLNGWFLAKTIFMIVEERHQKILASQQ